MADLPEAKEIWLRFSQFLRSTTNPNLVKDYKEWVAHLSNNPTFEASPSELIWPLFNDQPNQSGSGKEYIDIPYLNTIPLENAYGPRSTMHTYGSKQTLARQ
jgi:hypothetical protein